MSFVDTLGKTIRRVMIYGAAVSLPVVDQEVIDECSFLVDCRELSLCGTN